MEEKTRFDRLQEQEKVLDLKQLIRMLFSRLHIILIVAALLAAAAACVLRVTTAKSYTSKAQIYVSGSAKDYASILKAAGSLNNVIENKELNLSAAQLSSMITVTASESNKIITINATAARRDLAHNIAEGLTEYALNEIAPYMATKTIELTSPATMPKSANSADTVSKIILAGLLGAVIVCLVILIKFLRRAGTVADDNDVQRLFSLPVLGSLPGPEEKSRLNQELERMAVQTVMNADKASRIMVTGSQRGDGATFTSAGLWKALSAYGEKALLLDADLRRSGMAAQLGIKEIPECGLLQVLTESAEPEPVSFNKGTEERAVLLNGVTEDTDVRISRLLAGGELDEALASFSGQYDRIVIDVPPMADSADALQIAGVCDGAVLVVNAGKTKQTEAAKCLDALENTGVPVLGIVLNRVKAESEGFARLFSRTKE